MQLLRSAAQLASALAIALTLPCSAVFGAGPPSGLDVRVVNTPLPIQGSVSVSNLPAPAQTQLVTLEAPLSSVGACPGFGTSINFNTVLNSDGSTAAFTIPAGTVLVVTAVDILGFDAAAGTNEQTRLFRGINPNLAEFSIRESFANTAGRIFHRYEFPAGVEVASPGIVCANANDNDLVLSGYLYGYLKSAP
jgi:hypothetical protein